MKDNLVGRVVGYSAPHLLHPSQVEEGEPLDRTITRWGRVLVTGPFTAIVAPRHGPCVPRDHVSLNAIHTTMPETY